MNVITNINDKKISMDLIKGKRNNKAVNLIDYIYPIGSIYMSINPTSPSELFGGTWEQIKDKFLLSAGDTYEAGTKGGEATHTLTVDEMPSHSHNYTFNQVWDFGGGTESFATYSGAYGGSGIIKNTGGNQPHNNMPPYLAVYIWKRIA